MFAFIAIRGSGVVVLVVIALLLFARTRRVDPAMLNNAVRASRKGEWARPTQPAPTVPPWVLAALARLWQEFYFWTIDDWD